MSYIASLRLSQIDTQIHTREILLFTSWVIVKINELIYVKDLKQCRK